MIHGRTYGFADASAAGAVLVDVAATAGVERCWMWHGVGCETDVVSSACETARS